MDEFHIGLPEPPTIYRKRRIHTSEYTVVPYRKWRIIPDFACFSGRSIFCVDTLVGNSFMERMKYLLDMEISEYIGDRLKEDFRIVSCEAKRILLLNQKVIYSFKRLYNAWRYKNLRTMNEDDPITLSMPDKPVYIINSRYRFVYEAKTIALDIHKRLLHHDGQVPDPQGPRNPLTNQNLTLPQMISVISQCAAYGYTHWTMEFFKKSNYDVDDFARIQRNPLRFNAITKILNNHLDIDGIEALTDFIQIEFEKHGMLYPTAAFCWAIRTMPDDIILEEWRSLCKQWYSSLIFDNITISISHLSESLCKRSSYLRDRYIESRRTQLPS
jgi:hypothetical protein